MPRPAAPCRGQVSCLEDVATCFMAFAGDVSTDEMKPKLSSGHVPVFVSECIRQLLFEMQPLRERQRHTLRKVYTARRAVPEVRPASAAVRPDRTPMYCAEQLGLLVERDSV